MLFNLCHGQLSWFFDFRNLLGGAAGAFGKKFGKKGAFAKKGLSIKINVFH